MEVILKYFPNLSEGQIAAFEKLGPELREWNNQINVISRKDIQNLYLHHVLHSLAILKFSEFTPGTKILDLGTGGGFPGIPMAIVNPELKFTLIDARAKKIKVVEELCKTLKIKNISAFHQRAEDLKGKFDFVVSRAVAPLPQLLSWSVPLIAQKQFNAIPNGLICLKGGDLKKELKKLPKGAYFEQVAIKKWFKEAFFDDKYVIYVQG